MPRLRPRGEKIAIGFMVVWLVFWSAGILVVIYGLGAAVLGGDPIAVLMMALWLAGAGFGLWSGSRKLRQLLMERETPSRPARNHEWTGDIADPPERQQPSGQRAVRRGR
jgi:hypothetical protein